MREADAFAIVGMRKMEESPVSARKKGAKMPTQRTRQFLY